MAGDREHSPRARAVSRGLVRRGVRRLRALGRRAGVLPYEPEHWTTEQWTEAYAAGRLGYYGGLDELGRYSVVVGYAGWWAQATGREPKILDVGCGTGLLRDRLGPVPISSYVGVDLSEASIAEASGKGHRRSQYVVGDSGEVDLGQFDVVVLNEVLYYAPDARAVLARVRSLLEPGGVVVVSMWRHPGDRSLWRTVGDTLAIVDRVEVRNRRNAVNPRGWQVAMCAGPGPQPAPGGPRLS